jgi:hypothetical protein
MSSPLEYLDAAGADEADFESPMRELYAYRDGESWRDGFVTGVKPGGAQDGATLVQFDGRIWVPAAEVRASDHYVAVLLNPDDSVYTEVVQSFIDGKPADPIRDVATVDGQTVGTAWHPVDAPSATSTRVPYRYAGTTELG